MPSLRLTTRCYTTSHLPQVFFDFARLFRSYFVFQLFNKTVIPFALVGYEMVNSQRRANCYFAIGFYFYGKSIQKHPDSVCENEVNNEQNIRGYYYVKPLNERLIILQQKKTNCYFGFYFQRTQKSQN